MVLCCCSLDIDVKRPTDFRLTLHTQRQPSRPCLLLLLLLDQHAAGSDKVTSRWIWLPLRLTDELLVASTQHPALNAPLLQVIPTLQYVNISTPPKRNCTTEVFLPLLCPRPLGLGALSDDARLTSVCLTSVAYIGPKSRTEKPRKTKIGTEVANETRDSDTTFKVKWSNGQRSTCRGRGHIVADSRTACFYYYSITITFSLHRFDTVGWAIGKATGL